MGALDQLRNPSSWLVADDAAMSTVLAQVAKLREMLGIGAACMSYLIRFDRGTCQLQQSTDGGTTWVEVDGWSTFAACLPPHTIVAFTEDCKLEQSFDGGTTYAEIAGWDAYWKACVQAQIPVIGLPPNPGGQTPDQLACSIASYLANQVILEGLQAATTAITDDLSLLSMADTILTIIPEFILVRAFVDGASIVYTAVQEGTLSDFEAALTDATLWQDIACAIYAAIVGDGYVTPANCAAIAAGIHAIGYTPSAVQDAIDHYVSAIGCEGLAQLSQRAGLEVGADCSCGGGWCVAWDFTVDDGGWTAYDGDGFYAASYSTAVGWYQCPPPNPVSGGTQLRIKSPVGLTPQMITGVSANYTNATDGGAAAREFLLYNGASNTWNGGAPHGSGSGVMYGSPGVLGDTLYLWFNSDYNVDPMGITRISIVGSGPCPWPGHAC
jgi:hypothetical protein